MISITRWIAVSVTPPQYPEIPPITTPSTNERNTPTSPTDSEIVEPCTMRLQMSQPNLSAPAM